MPVTIASRGDRILAVIVDAAVSSVIGIPLVIWTGAFTALFHGQSISWPVVVELIVIPWSWYFLVNTYWLMKYGQTVGKRYLGIRIADSRTEEVPAFWRLLLRLMIQSLPGFFGVFGRIFGILDILFVFRKDRRCIHDLLARTHVVKTWG
jgi:uncharacterized RDD family membrane protein YckC